MGFTFANSATDCQEFFNDCDSFDNLEQKKTMASNSLNNLFSNTEFKEVFDQFLSLEGELRIKANQLRFQSKDKSFFVVYGGESITSLTEKLKEHIQDCEINPLLLKAAGFELNMDEYWTKKFFCGGELQIWKSHTPTVWALSCAKSPDMDAPRAEGSVEDLLKIAEDYSSKIKKKYLFGPAAIQTLINEGLELTQSELPRRATQVFVGWIDDACWAGAFDEIGNLLNTLNTDTCISQTLTGIMMMTKCVEVELGESRTKFVNRAIQSLKEVHQWDEERIARAVKRLA